MPSEEVKRLNPGVVFGPRGVVAPKPKQRGHGRPKAAALEGGRSGVAVCVEFVCFRKRLLDEGDNLPFSLKPLRDRVAASLGIDDADPRVTWKYHQFLTEHSPCVIVKMELIELCVTKKKSPKPSGMTATLPVLSGGQF